MASWLPGSQLPARPPCSTQCRDAVEEHVAVDAAHVRARSGSVASSAGRPRLADDRRAPARRCRRARPARAARGTPRSWSAARLRRVRSAGRRTPARLSRPVTASSAPSVQPCRGPPHQLGRAENRRRRRESAYGLDDASLRRAPDAAAVEERRLREEEAPVLLAPLRPKLANTFAPSMKNGRRSSKKVSNCVRLTTAGSTSTWPKSGLIVASAPGCS